MEPVTATHFHTSFLPESILRRSTLTPIIPLPLPTVSVIPSPLPLSLLIGSPLDFCYLPLSSETSQVHGEQTQGHQGQERVPHSAWGHQQLCLQILHPWPLRHHRRECKAVVLLCYISSGNAESVSASVCCASTKAAQHVRSKAPFVTKIQECVHEAGHF